MTDTSSSEEWAEYPGLASLHARKGTDTSEWVSCWLICHIKRRPLLDMLQDPHLPLLLREVRLVELVCFSMLARG